MRNLGALISGQVVTWSMTLVWTLVVPRALGPMELGYIVSAQAASGVLSIALGLGTLNYLVRETVIDRDKGSKLVGTALVLRVVMTPAVALGAVLWAHIAHENHQATTVLYLITAMTVLTLLAEPFQAAFQAIERMKYMAYYNVINKTAQSLIGIALVLLGFKAVGIAANMAIIAAVLVVLNALWLRPLFRIDLRTSVGKVADMVKQSAAYWVFGTFGFIYLWIDTLMLTLMTRSEVVGWYGATTTLFQTLTFLPVLVATAWLPRLVAVFAEDHKRLVDAARAPIELVFLVSVPIAVGTAMVSPELIHGLYGSAFAHAVPVMIVLAFCIPPMYLNIMLAQVLLAAKRQIVWTVVMAGAAIVNPLVNLVLIPLTQSRYHNGAIGAALSLVLTESLMDIVGVILVGRHVFRRSGVRRVVLAVVASAGMWAAAYFAEPAGDAISLSAGVVTLIALAAAFRIVTTEEIASMRASVRRLRGRLVPGSA